jgi:glycosyltransferase involved in cell wall biosynthesis
MKIVAGSHLHEASREGLTISRAEGVWLDQAAVVVLPAWIEHQPRRLLRALAAGVPVIASDACGLPPRPGLTVVPAGDAEALARVLASVIGARETVVVQENAA